MTLTSFPSDGLPAGAVAEAACAKVNLTLHVTGRRPDGYHELESLVVFAGVHDTVIAAPSSSRGDGRDEEDGRAGGLSLAVQGPMAEGLRAEPDNIILRAARALAAAAGRPPAAALTLIKRLPVASGIGGGSADAAAALRALARLWHVDLATVDGAALAARLGADVPVCLEGRAVTMTGIGEHLTPAPALPGAALLLVNPLRPVATPAVFKARTGGFSPPMPLTEAPADAAALAAALAARTNDLAPPALVVEPSIGAVLDALEALPGVLLARMSGSGATCFGLFADLSTASAAAAVLAQHHPHWWRAAAPMVTDTAEVAPVL